MEERWSTKARLGVEKKWRWRRRMSACDWTENGWLDVGNKSRRRASEAARWSMTACGDGSRDGGGEDSGRRQGGGDGLARQGGGGGLVGRRRRLVAAVAAAAQMKEEGGHIDFCQLGRMKGLRPKLNRSLWQFANRFEIEFKGDGI